MTDTVADAAASADQPDPLTELVNAYASGRLQTLAPLLSFLRLKGRPYSIENYAPFAPLYNLRQPHRTYFKCGRQVAKTTNMSAQTVLQAGLQSHFSQLFVAPRYEQIRRVSANYVKPFIEQSLLAARLQGKDDDRSVLQKTFKNDSRMYFSFAFLDVDRIRGLSVDAVNYDEIQDIDFDFIPVIRECMSASQLGIEKYFGTPKTLDNTLEALWDRDSSQAEWVIRCEGCNHDNIPSIHYDLLKMIGPLGPCCSQCGKLINPRHGRWVHAFSDRRAADAGYHIPQIIMPMHYEDPRHPGRLPLIASEKWIELLGKRDGRRGYTTAKFTNEVLGESCDLGVKLVTVTDIRNVSVLNVNELRAALNQVHKYSFRVLAVDWGGGGEDQVSTTTFAVVGLNIHTGRTECFYTQRISDALGHHDQAKLILDMFSQFQCHLLTHDYGGAGAIRETLLIQAGMPLGRIMPFLYVRATTKKMVEYTKARSPGERGYYTLDKARSLVLQATAIKAQTVLLPEYNSSQAITADLLALMEDKHETHGGADIFLVIRNPKLTDDFAHALNFGCVACWHVNNAYPDLSALNAIKLTPEQRNFAEPPRTA